MNRFSRSFESDPAVLRETLVRHARGDGPSPEMRDRILANVAATGAAVGAGVLAASLAHQSVSASTAKVGALVVTKWAIAGAVAATAMLGVREAVIAYDEPAPSVEIRESSRQKGRTPGPRAIASLPIAPATASAAVASGSTASSALPSTEPTPPLANPPTSSNGTTGRGKTLGPRQEDKDPGERRERAVVAEAEPAPPPVASVSPATARGDVAAQLPRELEYLERTRALLANQSPGAALEALSDYERAFPNGGMKVEASAFRVEALAAAGRRQEAALQARAFLAAHPKNPMADRVRGVLVRLETMPARP